MQKTYQKSVDVEVPVPTAYAQWTQFESFPEFMEGVDEVRRTGDRLTHWRTSIGGVTREFDAEIAEQRPDERIAWHAIDGVRQAGVVTFQRLDETRTRVHLQLELETEGPAETLAAASGIIGARIHGDLKRFKEFIETHGPATGERRSRIDPPTQSAPPVL
ncbi:cyclase [Actinorhabdospora filicis]|uniref:Cyclase n=1 Tax=Actinorhabdospora filicis TaxID=1785913 RepID=A0A9W6SLC7_9ACTN|nr:SRPBCC family protein [Actinorhabdospora filicis]GLZ77912.1 cyclase [Actinorhabdospora filicis]